MVHRKGLGMVMVIVLFLCLALFGCSSGTDQVKHKSKRRSIYEARMQNNST